jgi:hypothetical protein
MLVFYTGFVYLRGPPELLSTVYPYYTTPCIFFIWVILGLLSSDCWYLLDIFSAALGEYIPILLPTLIPGDVLDEFDVVDGVG